MVSPGGKRLLLEPKLVVQLMLTEVERPLATRSPELAVFAAWTVHDQRGREGREVGGSRTPSEVRSSSESLRER